MSRYLIVGNWKMNFNTSQASVLVHRLQERIKSHRDVEIVLCPSLLTLQPLSLQVDRRKFRLGAQDAFYVDEGAYTGEVSANMLRDLVSHVIVGHSERRHIIGERDDLIAKKVAAVRRNGMTPILCVGETKQERVAKETRQALHDQLTVDLKDMTSSDMKHVVIAYEPVWAISKGTDYAHHETAKPDQVKEAVDVIRKNLTAMFGKKIAEEVPVLYGGSVNADSAGGYLVVEGINGLLVGGASLNYQQFSNIVARAGELADSVKK